MSTLFYIYDKYMRNVHNKYKFLHLTNIKKAAARSSTTVERNSFYKNRKSLCRVLCGIHPSQSSFCPRDEIWWIVLTTILNPDGRWRANELRIRLWQHQASAAQWRLSEPQKRWTGACKSHHKKGQRKLAEAATKKVEDERWTTVVPAQKRSNWTMTTCKQATKRCPGYKRLESWTRAKKLV